MSEEKTEKMIKAKEKGKTGLIVVLLIVLAFAGGGYYAYTQMIAKPTEAQKPAPATQGQAGQPTAPAPDPNAQQQPAPEPPKPKEPKEVVLAKGILLEFLDAGSKQKPIYQPALDQRIVEGVSWKMHPQTEAVATERFHFYLKTERAGTYTFNLAPTSPDFEVQVHANGNVITRTLLSTNQSDAINQIDVDLPVGMNEISVYITYYGKAQGAGLQVLFGYKGMRPKAISNESYSSIYQVYHDKNEYKGASEKVFKFEDEKKPAAKK